MPERSNVAIVHDHLLHLGGSERVILSMHRAFPEAPVYTAFFDTRRTFPELEGLDIRPLPINRVRLFHRNHRLAFPFLAAAFQRLQIDADVTLCSSSGWAHGTRSRGQKIVYCYSPANWLYRAHQYVGAKDIAGRVALGLFRRRLTKWDQAAAASADRYLTTSTAVQDRIRSIYGIEATVLPPPPPLDPAGPRAPVEGLSPGYFLNISRLVPHKNVDVLVRTFEELADQRLVVVGSGPIEDSLKKIAPRNVTFLGLVTDSQLRWLYANCSALISASYEDFGLTPLEAASFGRPSIVLRWGGFLDTVIDGTTGFFFERPEPDDIISAIKKMLASNIQEISLIEQAGRFSEENFIQHLRAAVRIP